MKRFLLITSLFLISSTGVFAQDDDDQHEGNERIRDKMNEYVQKRLDLTDAEAKKFTPVFLSYFKEWKQTIRANRDDKLVRQQKIIDLRLRFRTQFRDIIGEQRGNQVFNHVDRFILELKAIQKNRLRDNPRPRRGG